MYELIREPVDDWGLKQEYPLYIDTETAINEGYTDGGLYGKIRLIQLYQEHWDKVKLVDCFFLDPKYVLSGIKNYHWVGHNLAYDLNTINLITNYFYYPKKLDDTLLLARHTWTDQKSYSLDNCLAKAGVQAYKNLDKKELQKSDWSGPLSEDQLRYAAEDVYNLPELYHKVNPNSNFLPYELDIEVFKPVIWLSRQGMPTNQETVQNHIQAALIEQEKTLNSLPVNPNSPKQVTAWLDIKKSDKNTLLAMANKGDKRAELIVKARTLTKMLSYLKIYDRPVVYGFFSPSTAASGRMSCDGGNRFDHGNLQQVPNHLHDCFESPEDKTFIYKDYSGIEMRTAVAFTGEEVMADLMLSGADMHTETGKYLFNLEEITKLQRDITKTISFGVIYGASYSRVQQELAAKAGVFLEFKEVKQLVDSWFKMYYGLAKWHKISKNAFHVFQYLDVETALGRKVRCTYLPDALNIPIQGTAGEVHKVALLKLWKKHGESLPLVNTIHDANIMMTDKRDAGSWGLELDNAMVSAWEWVTKDLPIGNLPMPSGYETDNVWRF